MPALDSHPELLPLLEKLCNGRLSEAEGSRLQELLRDNLAAQQTYFAYLELHLGLNQIVNVEAPDPQSARDAHDIVLPSRLRSNPTRAIVLAAGLLCVGIAVLITLLTNPSDSPIPEAAPRIARVQGNVSIVGATGDVRDAAEGMELLPGQRLETQDRDSLTQLLYPDGTTLTLLRDTAMTRADNGRQVLTLHRGVVSAEVAPQRSANPMLLSTPTARVEVLGTRFALAARSARTELNVAEGRVKVTRVADGQSIEVAGGQSLVANGQAQLAVHDLNRPAEWDVQFEAGLPQGWRGRAVETPGPNNSQGAVRPETEENSEPRIHVIATSDEWVNGLFDIREKTHLHVTLKMETPNWLNVFFSARDADATKPSWALHIFNEIPFWKQKPGEWRTITIPLSKFRRKRDGVFRQESPKIGDVAYELSISCTEDDRGLVVDRIWITHEGPGIVEAKPVR